MPDHSLQKTAYGLFNQAIKRVELPQEKVAWKLGVSSSILALWETGRRHPRGLYRKKLERFLQRVDA